MTDTTQPPTETLAVRHVPQAWIDRAMQIEAAADGLVSTVNDAVQRGEEGSGRLYAANRVQLDKWATQVLEAINLPEPVFIDSLTRCAGGDAIPAGEASEALRALERFVGDHSGNDDTTDGMKVDRRAQQALSIVRSILAPVPEGERFTGEQAWDELVNVDDRTSPEEYPDMCLITRDELIDFMNRAALSEGRSHG